MDRYTANIIDDGHGNIYLQYDKNKDGQWYAASDVAELAKRVLPYIEAYRRYCLENLLNVNDYKGANEIIAELEELAEGNDG